MQLLATLISIDSQTVQPVYLQIANGLIELIKEGTLPASQRLLSTRKMAGLLKVHRKTVVRAYDELLAQGWLKSKGGSGTYVSEDLPEVKPKKFASKTTNDQGLKTAGFEIGTADHLTRKIIRPLSKYHLDDGYPDVRIAPLNDLARAYSNQLKVGNKYLRLGYGDTKGSLWLREELCNYFRDTRGLNITVENILITRGTIMCLFLVSNALLTPGDNVAMGQLGWMSAYMNFIQAKANVIKIPTDSYGIVVDELRKVCLSRKIRLVYVTPHHNYPTTVALRADRRMQLINLAKEFGFIIFEDDYDYDFHYLNKPLQPLIGADKNGHVLYCGSFTKTIAPGFRVGYLVGPENVIERLAMLRRIVDRQGDNMLENAIAELLQFGIIQKHLRKSVRIYRERRDYFCNLMNDKLTNKVSFHVPEGGMAAWTTFDSSIKLADLAAKAAKRDIYINNCSGQLQNQNEGNSVRLGFASSDLAELEYMIETINILI